jgi:hypothetical protein
VEVPEPDVTPAFALHHHPRVSQLKHSANMTLDIDAFRPEKGGDPEKVRENQRKRFADPTMVDKVVASDESWRKGDGHV